MHREIHHWHSPRLDKNMEIAVYGHYGFALLMFPTAAADYLEYERFYVIDALAPFINAGKCKVIRSIRFLPKAEESFCATTLI